MARLESAGVRALLARAPFTPTVVAALVTGRAAPLKPCMHVHFFLLTIMNWGMSWGVSPPGGELDAHRQVGGLQVAGLHWYVSVATRPPADMRQNTQAPES